jgi:hypothetical protein
MKKILKKINLEVRVEIKKIYNNINRIQKTTKIN